MRLCLRAVLAMMLSLPLVAPSGAWADEAGALRDRAQALERQILPRRAEGFAASDQEMVVFLEGVVDLALAPKPGDAPTARAVGHMELVVDVATSTVVGEIYGLAVESGEMGGLVDASLPLQGHLTETAPGQYGAWVEMETTRVGRPTEATRASLRAYLDLRGSKAPRMAFGPVAGTFAQSGGRLALVGAAALVEVQGTPGTPDR